MFKKKISLLAFLILASSLSVACGKKEEVKEDATIEKTENKEELNEELKELSIDKKSFKDLTELKSFSKTKIKEFENILKSNKIDYVSSSDDSLIINKNMTYEKYTKEFNQLAYTQISKNYENGTGYLKTGIKLNIHMQEQASIENNFIKAMLDVVKIYNPNINEETFNEEIKKSTESADDISDKDITTGVEGITIKVYSKPDVNEREIVLSIRQELEFPIVDALIKEYKTVQEFKDDSAKLEESTIQKVNRINEVLKNSYIGKYKEIDVKINKFDANYTSAFSQNLEVEYKGTGITGLQDEMLNSLYELIEDIITKEKLSKILTLDEFKSYVKGLEIYAGAHTTGSIIDELGDVIEPNKLPFLSEVGLSISYTPSQIEENKNDVEEDKNKNSINVYDSTIKLIVSIPVKAEGITSL